MYYLLHGKDEFGRSQQLARWKEQMASGDPAMADLNTSLLDGRKVTMGELRHACDAIPFLTERRLVIVEGLLTRLGPKGVSKRGATPADEEPAWKRAFLSELADYLPRLPSTTRLVFVEAETLPATHRILKLAQTQGRKGGAYIKQFEPPRDDALPAWIDGHARDNGGIISTEAAAMLADLIGPDLRLLDLEIDKLVLYAEGRQITTQDVERLVSRARETVIWDLVDCIGRREVDAGLQLLGRLLEEGGEPLYLLTMLARQVRILIQIKEAADQGLAKDAAAKALGLHPYVVKKGLVQAHYWTMEQLQAAHEKVIEADQSIKTGELEPALTLDLLVVALTQL